jgi:hypothetical protein
VRIRDFALALVGRVVADSSRPDLILAALSFCIAAGIVAGLRAFAPL